MDYTVPRYAQETKHYQIDNTDVDIPIKGFSKHLELDIVIPQGITGAIALEKAMRECMGNEPGSTLHVGVLYTKLRLEIIQGIVSRPIRVFLPGFMTLLVEPYTEPRFMRVRVFRFTVMPSTCDTTGRVPKRKNTQSTTIKKSSKVDRMLDEDSDISDTATDDEKSQPECPRYNQLSGRSRYSQRSESFPFTPQCSTTLRHDML
jgi:hypothetical protein